MFTTVRLSTSSYCILLLFILILSFHVCLGLTSDYYFQDFLCNFVFIFLIFIRAASATRLGLLDLVTLIMFDEEHSVSKTFRYAISSIVLSLRSMGSSRLPVLTQFLQLCFSS